MSTTVEAEYLSVQGAARLLDVAPVTIRRKVAAGELPATQLGGRGSAIRIVRADLDAWLWPGREPERERHGDG